MAIKLPMTRSKNNVRITARTASACLFFFVFFPCFKYKLLNDADMEWQGASNSDGYANLGAVDKRWVDK